MSTRTTTATCTSAAGTRTSIDRFLDFARELDAASRANPFNDHERIFDGCAVALSWLRHYVYISSFRALIKKKGNGTRALTRMCALADKYDLDIQLSPEPFGLPPRISHTKLIEFYGRFGFVFFDRSNYMIRRSKQQ